MDLFQREQKRGGAGGLCISAHRRAHQELAYQRSSEATVQDENCFKIFIYKQDCRITIELMDTEPDESAKKADEAKRWSSYKERFADCSLSEGKHSGWWNLRYSPLSSCDMECLKLQKPSLSIILNFYSGLYYAAWQIMTTWSFNTAMRNLTKSTSAWWYRWQSVFSRKKLVIVCPYWIFCI